MFALYEWFRLPTTITCRPSRSFFLFLFVSFFYVNKKLYIHCYLWEKLFFVHPHSYTWRTFSVYTHIKTLSLYVNTINIQILFMFKDLFFSFFPTQTNSLYKSFFIYTRRSHTQEFLFTHYLHTQKSFYTHFPFTYIYKKPFSFLYIRRHFIHNASFFLSWVWFILFLFWTKFQKMKNSMRFKNFNRHYWQPRSKYKRNNSNDMYAQNKSQSKRNKR